MVRPLPPTSKRCRFRNARRGPWSFWTTSPPTRRRSRQSHARSRVLVSVLASVRPRPEPDRNSLLKAQGAPPTHRRMHLHGNVFGHRGSLRSVHRRRMPELIQGCRIGLKSKAGFCKAFLGIPDTPSITYHAPKPLISVSVTRYEAFRKCYDPRDTLPETSYHRRYPVP